MQNNITATIGATMLLAIGMSTYAEAQSQRFGNAMEFLDVPAESRLVATGGLHTVSGVGSSSMIFHNPSAIADSLDGFINLNISPVADGIKYASGAYVHKQDGIGTLAGGLQYAGYGDFTRTDEDNIEMGTFTANEVALYLTYAREIIPSTSGRSLHLGATLKPMLSSMDTDKAFGLAMDFGATLKCQDDRMVVAMTIRNLGGVIKKYSDNNVDAHIPFDIKLGLAYKAEHAPFRFLLTLKDLTHWDLATNRGKGINAGDNILRHTIIGVEFVPVKAFYFGFGYNQRRRREMSASEAGGMAGISWGAGLKVKRIEVKYAHNRYHIAGSLNSISICANWKSFR